VCLGPFYFSPYNREQNSPTKTDNAVRKISVVDAGLWREAVHHGAPLRVERIPTTLEMLQPE
jgi:hypothetical protein